MLFGLWPGSNTQSESYELGQPLSERIGPRTGQGSVIILVIGRSGTGKSYFIDSLCPREPNEPPPRLKATVEVTAFRRVISGTKYKFIDTPGFDNVELGDVEICARITRYLRESRETKYGVHGIVYIHQSHDPPRSESLRRYLTALSEVLLGSIGMLRLTIFLAHAKPHEMGGIQIKDELRDRGSILSKVNTMGARIILASDPLPAFADVMEFYALKEPISLPVQQYRPNLISDLEAILHEKLAPTYSTSHEDRIKQSYERKLDELHSNLDAKESDLAEYRDALHRAEQLRAGQQEAEASLRRQLQQVQREYASLRSELQLQENFEQSEIVQELEDLNRQIDDISRTISAYLTDTHVCNTFGKDPADVTALDARNLPGLFELLGYSQDKCSLISSSKGKGLEIESFLDFVIRDLLCMLVFTGVFEPFHPAIDSDQSEALLYAYEDIKKRESQTRSGKWRSSTFKSIYKVDGPDQVANWINELLHRFIRQFLSPLLLCIFGTKDATMDRQHYNQIHELVRRAWDWNAKLKGEVIVLGDFRQTLHTHYTIFDSSTMKDFEPQPSKQATYVLGMVGLGLISLRAIGGGQSPVATLICKATVTTDTLYA